MKIIISKEVLIDKTSTLYPENKMKNNTFPFTPRAHETFTKCDYVLGHKKTFSDQCTIKPVIIKK